MKNILNKKTIVTAIISLVFFIGPLKAEALPGGFEIQTLASGLNLPTSMAFSPDGRIFIAEKTGSVRIIENGNLLATPLISLSDVNSYGDRGLIGIAIDPNFSQNGYLYLAYTYENTPGLNFSGIKTARVVRITVVGNTASESTKTTILGSIGGNLSSPSCDNYSITSDCIASDAPSHTIGGMRFGPDGKLYIATGDGAHFDYADARSLRAQNIDSLSGKILRINTDGTGPSDNPFYNGNPNSNRSKVYAYGFRNAFRFNFRPSLNSLYAGDVGWSTYEEVNKVTPGGNYGWPCKEGNVTTPNGPGCTAVGAIDPIYVYAHDVNGAGSVTAGSFPSGSAYPSSYLNTYFFGDYAQNWIKTMTVDGSDVPQIISNFGNSSDGTNGPVEFMTGPEGNIYFISIYTGELKKITHTSGNRQPLANISTTPTSGIAPLIVNFSSSGSIDPDGDPITFLWDFGDNSTSTLANPVHTYINNGSYMATLTIFDDKGGQQTKSVNILVGNQAPTAQINSPSSGSLYNPGDILVMSGAGTDPEDGVIPNGNMSWRVILHHNVHIHILETHTGNNISFTAPDHGDPDVYTEIELTVTDSVGLTDKTSTYIYLNNSGAGNGNLVDNHSMETTDPQNPNTPANWSQDYWGVNSNIFTYPVTGYEGINLKGGKVQITSYTSGDAKWAFAPILVTPNTVYTFSDYYKSDVTSTLVVETTLSNGSKLYTNLGTLPAQSNFTNATKTFTTLPNARFVTVYHLIEQVGSLTTDNYSLVMGTPDTQSPSVSIVTPTASSTVSNIVDITATSTDNVGVAGVQFFLDGNSFGLEDTTSPYSIPWNTASSTNGAHNIFARSRDSSGNVATSTTIVVNVGNAGTTTGNNLLTNGNFETANGNLPQNWTKGGWGTNTRILTYPVTGSGSTKAVRTEITSHTSGDAKWVHANIPVVVGKQYVYKDSYRSNVISDVIGQYKMSNGSFSYFGLVKEIPPNSNWTEISGTFSPPVGATHVTFFHLISSVGFVEIDNVEIRELGSGTPGETVPPIVEFTNPLNNQTVSGIVNITASSTDNVGTTYIFYAVDGNPITGQLTTPPYSYLWDTNTVSNGPHLIKATTHDPSGNNSTSTITVIVNNNASSTNLILNPGVEVENGTRPLNWSSNKWGTNTTIFTYPVVGQDGTKAVGINMTSHTSGDAKWFFDDVVVTPGAQYTFSEYYKSNVTTNVTVRWKKSDGTVTYQSLGNLPAASSWTKITNSLTIPAGVTKMTVFHLIKKVGTLEVDNYSLVMGTPDTQSPSVSIVTPTASSTVSNIVDITATSTDNVGVAGVQFFLDGNSFGLEDTTSPYSIPWNTASSTNGAHNIFARSRDSSGNVATSTTIVVNVGNATSDTTPPTVTISNPVDGSSVSNTTNVSVNASDNISIDLIELSVDGIPLISASSTTTLNFLLDTTTLSNGIRTITARATDSSSNISTTSINIDVNNITIDNTPPVANISSPIDGSTIIGNATINVNATDNISVSSVHIFVDDINVVVDDTFPYQATIDSTVYINGNHTITAYAEDTSGNIGNATPILITTNNPPVIPPALNLISNPSVEIIDVADPSTPESWSKGNWGTNTATFTYPTSGNHLIRGAKIEITNYTDGDAKWFFDDVPVVEGETYTFKSQYKSDVPTIITARFGYPDNSVQYRDIANLPPAGVWTTSDNNILIPPGANKITIFHIINTAGTLEIDDYYLGATISAGNQFTNGLVSLTFDDGWVSHYTDALPILSTSNIKAGFYIISQESIESVPNNRISNYKLEIPEPGNPTNPMDWNIESSGSNDAVFSYPTPGNSGNGAKIEMTTHSSGEAKWVPDDTTAISDQEYKFSFYYKSNVDVPVVGRFTLNDNTVFTLVLGTATTSNNWVKFERNLYVPINLKSLTFYPTLDKIGFIEIDDFDLNRIPVFLNPTQIQTMKNLGHEIGSHTQTHPYLTTLSGQNLTDEVLGSKVDITNTLGITGVNTFVYPYGDYNTNVKQEVINSGYLGARTVDRGLNYRDTDKFALKIQQVDRTTNLTQFQSWIDEARNNKAWLILMFHQVNDDPNATLGVSPALLQQMIDALVSQQVTVINMEQGLGLMNP